MLNTSPLQLGPHPRLPGEEYRQPRWRLQNRQPQKNTQEKKHVRLRRPQSAKYHGSRSERFPDPTKTEDNRWEMALADFRNTLQAARLKDDRQRLKRYRKQQLEKILRRSRRPPSKFRVLKSEVKKGAEHVEAPWWETAYTASGEMKDVRNQSSDNYEDAIVCSEDYLDYSDERSSSRRSSWLSRLRRVQGSVFVSIGREYVR